MENIKILMFTILLMYCRIFSLCLCFSYLKEQLNDNDEMTGNTCTSLRGERVFLIMVNYSYHCRMYDFCYA